MNMLNKIKQLIKNAFLQTQEIQHQRIRPISKIESLESREMLTQFVEFENGVLDVHLQADGMEGETVMLANDRGDVVDFSGNSPLNSEANIEATSVSEIRIHGSSKNDNINLSQVDRASFPNLEKVTIFGGHGEDQIIGSEIADLIFGGKHADHINSRGGDDTIYGGPGHDEMLGGSGADKLYGGNGQDRLFGNLAHSDLDGQQDTLQGGRGKDFAFSDRLDRLKSARHQDRPMTPTGLPEGRVPTGELTAQDQSQTVKFENGVLRINLRSVNHQGETVVLGNDRGRVVDLSGNSPLNDTLFINANDVVKIQIYGSKHGDTINLSQVDHVSFSSLEMTKLVGRNGNDTIVGSQVKDKIFGGRHDDVIEGQGGNDLIKGNQGNDFLQGGLGADGVFGGVGSDWLYGLTHAYDFDGEKDFLHGGTDKDRDWGFGEKLDRIRHCN